MNEYEEFALRTALAIHNLGWNSLSITEELGLTSSPEYRDRVYEYLHLLQKGVDPRQWVDSRRLRAIRKVILDKPLLKYISLLNNLTEASGNEDFHVDFLCNDPGKGDLHFYTILDEYGIDITYEYLNVPVNEWNEWKKRPEYKGE